MLPSDRDLFLFLIDYALFVGWFALVAGVLWLVNAALPLPRKDDTTPDDRDARRAVIPDGTAPTWLVTVGESAAVLLVFLLGLAIAMRIVRGARGPF